MANYREKQYKLLRDAYYGDGMFLDGRGLIRHERETAKNYGRRRKLAYYLNYTGPIVDSTVAPVFKNEIKRDYNASKLFEIFFDDCDRQGTSLQSFMRRQATLAKLYGVVYVVVTNDKIQGDTQADSIANRSLPYVKIVLPKDVKGWHFTDRGILKDFTYEQRIYDDDGWHIRYTEWTQTGWKIYEEGGRVIEQGEHNLGVVPIVQWFGRDTERTRMLPSPEYLSVAQTNYHIYHLCSLLSQISDGQTFSLLTMPAVGSEADITVGTNNLLLYPVDATKGPAYIAPDSGPANVLISQISNLINEMYRMSGLNSVIGVESAKSGLAKQWDFERTNQRIADFAVQCEIAEKAIVALYELWTGETIDYTCEYPRDFNIKDVAESLTQAQQATDLHLPSPTFNIEVGKKVLEAYMPNLEAKAYDQIIREISESSEKEQQDVAYTNGILDETGA